MDYEISTEQSGYIQRLATRYVRYRKSGSIDKEDLISAANSRWWQFCLRQHHSLDETLVKMCFYEQVKGAMRDVVRSSSPVNVTRTMHKNMQAYQQPYTVDLNYAVNILAGDEQGDHDQWLDVVTSLGNLPQREQIILSLYFERDLNFSRIAEILEVSVSTITRSYQSALEHIRKDLHII
ncbi:MAG: sigma-70 family RNA polymerase sigma factor [Acidibacillus sp.]|nr:sigma-70 family RNA polymerase sigma factor [Acidibacillus sp.]